MVHGLGRRLLTGLVLALGELLPGVPALALQAVREAPHDVDHAMGAMLWSMGVLIGVPVGLVAVAAVWYRWSQRPPDADAGRDRDTRSSERTAADLQGSADRERPAGAAALHGPV